MGGKAIFEKSHNLTWNSWRAMIGRCRNKNDSSYKDYGGRGINVHLPWYDFMIFLRDMGERPSREFSIGRKDNNKGYDPSNCSWETIKEQQNNRRSNRIISYNGKTQNLTEWASDLGIAPSTLVYRLNNFKKSYALTKSKRKYIQRLCRNSF